MIRCLRQAGELGRTLQALQRLDPAAAPLLEAHQQAAAAWGELQSALRRYADTVEVEPDRLRQLEERVNLLHVAQTQIRRDAGRRDRVRRRGEEEPAKSGRTGRRTGPLEWRAGKAAREILQVGQELSAQRRQAIPKLAKAAMQQLHGLGFQQSRFDAELRTGEDFTASGLDEIEFQFAPNAGEPARPLRAIASSGEMSRVMLALKTVLAAQDEIPVLVFDEIDANVGGETAAVVGEKMARIARRRQVICITHLPAVAAGASSHFVVTKRTEGGRTISEITLLDRAQRVQELTRMLGGQTEAARRHAEELLLTGVTRNRFGQLERMHAAEYFGFTAVAGEFEVIIGLNAHPKFGRDVEQTSQLEGHFRAHGALAPDDFADGNGCAANGLGHGISGQAQRLHKVLAKHVARMNGIESVFAFVHNIFNDNPRFPPAPHCRLAKRSKSATGH
jgi:hypothetical protein